MAGFLPAANEEEKLMINNQLNWLYDNQVCSYPVVLPDLSTARYFTFSGDIMTLGVIYY